MLVSIVHNVEQNPETDISAKWGCPFHHNTILPHLKQKQGLGPLLAEQPSLDGAHVSDAAM
jgi:hypothetical protein